MSVGRKRKGGNPLGLEDRVYPHHGQFTYLHRDGKREGLGTDLAKANARARTYNDQTGSYGTLCYFFDLYMADAENGRLHKNKSPRTISDNKAEFVWLKHGFPNDTPADLVANPSLISGYRDERAIAAPVRANRELSLLSAVYSWLIDKGHVPGLNVNPVKLIARNTEKPKDRYVEDPDVAIVNTIAVRAVCMAIELAYRTLQRPSDVLKMQPTDIRTKVVNGVAKRVLSVQQGKRGAHVDIEMSQDLEAAVRLLPEPPIPILHRPLVYARGYKNFTEGGLAAMLRRYCIKCGVKSFGLMDIRAKGATDMYLAGVPLERIQMLMRHKSVQTTEIYIKRMLFTISTVAPNRVKGWETSSKNTA